MELDLSIIMQDSINSCQSASINGYQADLYSGYSSTQST